MNSLQEQLASGATVLSTIVSMIGLIQSKSWLVALAAFSVGTSLLIFTYAGKMRERVRSANVRIEGKNLDSLNVANLRRSINQTLTVQAVERHVEIKGDDLRISLRYSGFCKAKRANAMQFSIDSDSNIPFSDLDCVGFDLVVDPDMRNPITPLLVGSDGLSKKIAIPFLSPVHAEEPFALRVDCSLPAAVKAGVDYYAATLSFNQASVGRHQTILKFFKPFPKWVRVYDLSSQNVATLVKHLPPSAHSQDTVRYIDDVADIGARSSRIYIFYRADAGDNGVLISG